MKLGLKQIYGFSLVEVTLALGVAAISLLAIFALLPFGLQTNQRAIRESAAADILSAVAADLRATPVTIPRGGAAMSSQYSLAIPPNPVGAATTATLFLSGAGQASPSLRTDSSCRLAVTFLPNGPGARTATFVHLKITWPAAAAIENVHGSAETFAAFDRN